MLIRNIHAYIHNRTIHNITLHYITLNEIRLPHTHTYIHTYLPTYLPTYLRTHTYMLIYIYVYSRPTYLYTNFPNVQQRLAQVPQDDSAQTQQSEKQYSCATSTLLQQHWNTWQLLWIFHGSGALPNQGHLQATAVRKQPESLDPSTLGNFQQNKAVAQQRRGLDPRKLGDSQQNKLPNNKREDLIPEQLGDPQQTAVSNRQRTWSQSTGGFSATFSKHTQTTMAAPADDVVTALAATHKLKLKPQHMMVTMPHMENGSTSSQHTWAHRTHSTQGCSGWPKQQHNKWQRHIYGKQLQHWRKQKHGFN